MSRFDFADPIGDPEIRITGRDLRMMMPIHAHGRAKRFRIGNSGHPKIVIGIHDGPLAGIPTALSRIVTHYVPYDSSLLDVRPPRLLHPVSARISNHQ